MMNSTGHIQAEENYTGGGGGVRLYVNKMIKEETERRN